MRFKESAWMILLLVSLSAYAQNNRSAVSLTGSDLATCTVPDPCRTIDVAMSKTNSGGEVVVLSTAGYGPFTVTKSISIIAPQAYHAAIAPATGVAITVNAFNSTVIIRNLFLNSLGASTGILINAVETVHLEHMVVSGFNGNGIEITASAEVFIKDAEVRGSTGSGVLVSTQGFQTAVVAIDGARLERNNYSGLTADTNASLTIRNVLAVRNVSYGFFFRNAGAIYPLVGSIENSVSADGSNGFVVADGAEVTIRDSVSRYNNGFGFQAYSNVGGSRSELILDRCLATGNTHGVQAGGTGDSPALITVSNSTVANNRNNGIVASTKGTVRAYANIVTRNSVGFNAQIGIIESAGNNLVHDNATEVLGTPTIVPLM